MKKIIQCIFSKVTYWRETRTHTSDSFIDTENKERKKKEESQHAIKHFH